MKTYCYDKYYCVHEREWLETLEKTEYEILEEYWEHWSRKMVEKHGPDMDLITHENCIDDWCFHHGAKEKVNA